MFPEKTNIQIFSQPSNATGGTQFTTWSKPAGKKMLYILCIGGGGGGGAGFAGADLSNRGGGGGGSSSAMSTLLVPLDLIPDNLFVTVGAGGIGATSGTGGSGQASYVTIAPTVISANINVLLRSSDNTVGGGGAGTGAAGGVGGNANSAGQPSTCCMSGLGLATFFTGQSGAAGGAPGVAGSQVIFPATGLALSGGAGGGGTTAVDQAGGFVTSFSNTYLSANVNTTQTTNMVGSAGRFQLLNPSLPFFSLGGNGGASSSTIAGFAGGEGGPGSGGGGGGAGTTSGRGGDGGRGLVLFIAW